jgi:hypothetical protein
VYLAIRRPNKPPTSGTQVYNAIARTGTGAAATVTGVGFAPDLVIAKGRQDAGYKAGYVDRLRGSSAALFSDVTTAEVSATTAVTAFGMDGLSLGADGAYSFINAAAPQPFINWFFRRAPGVMDQVCYTGTGVAKTEAHNLGVVPELMIVKTRSGSSSNWAVYHAAIPATQYIPLNTNGTPITTTSIWNNTSPTSTVFSVATSAAVNGVSATYVWYGFATKAGISKCGSYTGNGSNQTIDCGFTTGARFVLIKATSTTGNWTVFDTARGIIAGNDPYLLLNSTAAEDTDEDAVDTDNSGFIVNETTAALNTNTVSYVFLAFS